VKSPVDASLMYEMILSAVVWTKHKPKHRPWKNSSINSALRIDTPFLMAEMSLKAMDELVTSSGFVFDQVSLAIDNAFPYKF
jgi:hypothetical protein